MPNLVLFSLINYTREAGKSCSYNTNLVDQKDKGFLAQAQLGKIEKTTLKSASC